MLDAVGIELGVGDLEVNDSVDLHGDIILGDNGLGRIVQHLLLQADLSCDAVNEGNLEVQTNAPNALEGAQTLDDISAGLLDNGNVADDNNQNDEY